MMFLSSTAFNHSKNSRLSDVCYKYALETLGATNIGQ